MGASTAKENIRHDDGSEISSRFCAKANEKAEAGHKAHVILFISLLFASFVEGFFQSLIHALAHTERKVIYSCDSPGIIIRRVYIIRPKQQSASPLSTISEDSLCCHTLAARPATVHADVPPALNSHSLLCLPRVSFADARSSSLCSQTF
jgi:hypothetical protein